MQQIIAIAKELNVSTDYLLGLSGTPSVDEDIQVACKTTGLTEKAINAIKKSRGWGMDVLNCFLEDSDFWGLLRDVRRLAGEERRLKIAERTLIETADDRYARKVMQRTEKRDVCFYWAVKKFEKLLSATVDELISHKEFQRLADLVYNAVKREFNK